jgi:hypothetical protein
VLTDGSDAAVRAARSGPSRWERWVGYAACAWALLFAAAHVYWAVGGTALIGEGPTGGTNERLASGSWKYLTGWTVLTFLFVSAACSYVRTLGAGIALCLLCEVLVTAVAQNRR